MIAEGSTYFPEPTKLTTSLLLARPGPLPIDRVQSSIAQPTAMRSITEEAPGRICSIKLKYGSSRPSATGSSGVHV